MRHSDAYAELQRQAAACQRCELFKKGTQTVFGAGSLHASLLIVGEQPGDQEDRQGKPFVGPAGKLLRRCLDQAGISEDDVFFTNAVKHFNWRPKGKLRIHEKPKVSHIKACLPWLESEVRLVRPQVIVCLGTTAGRAVFGKPVTIARDGGKVLPSPLCKQSILYTHPAAILRLPDASARAEAEADMVVFFRGVKDLLRNDKAAQRSA